MNPPSTFNSNRVSPTSYPNLSSIDYKGFIAGLRFFPNWLQRYCIRKKFEYLQRLVSVRFDIVWSFDNSVFFDFSSLPPTVLKISHIVDLNQNFQTRKAAQSAVFCFCTTEHIKNRLLKFNSKVFKINHGFSFVTQPEVALALPGQSKIKVLYAGNLDMPFIDWSILNSVISDNPGVDFVFIGPNDDRRVTEIEQDLAKRSALNSSNVYLLAKLNSGQLQQYQKQADVLLVAYQEKYHKDQANPHKMMEYLGAGKLIVATFTAEFKRYADEGLFLMSIKNSEFSGLFAKAINELDYWNSEKQQDQRKKVALDNTYDQQINRIEEVIYDKKSS